MMSQIPSINLYKRIAVSFISLAIILLLVVGYFSLGKAVIKIEPKSKEYKTNFFINIGQKTTGTDLAENIFPGKILRHALEASKKFPTTGKKTAEAESDVVGQIKVQNNSDKAYAFVAKTRFLSASGILFRMKSPASIPANGSVEVDVYPDDKSFIGPLEPTSFTIPGLSVDVQKIVVGLTEKPLIRGGSDVYFLTDQDIENAKKDLSEELKNQALIEMRKSLKFREEIFPNTSTVKIISEQTSKQSGDTGQDFELTLKIEVLAVSLNRQDLADDVRIKIIDELPEGVDLLGFDPEMIQYELSKYDDIGQIATFKVLYAGQSMVNKNSKIFNKENFAGLTKQEATSYLSVIDDVKSVEIELSPFWVKRIPNEIGQINIVLVK